MSGSLKQSEKKILQAHNKTWITLVCVLIVYIYMVVKHAGGHNTHVRTISGLGISHSGFYR